MDGYEEALGVLLHKTNHRNAVLPKTKTVCNKVANRRKVVEAQIQSDAALAYKIKGTIYTNLPGKFPKISYKGNLYIFLTYIYDANAIIVRPMKSRSEQCMIKVFLIYMNILNNANLHRNCMFLTTNALKRWKTTL